MIQCQNCGEVNNHGSNFCRFCGTRMVIPQNAQNVDYQPPVSRPYMWKTDELPSRKSSARTTSEIHRVEPLQRHTAPNLQPQPYRPPSLEQTNYRCPRCGTHYLPQTVKKISTAGWIVFAVLLVFFLPLFWIGLLIKENVRICPACRARVG